MLEIIGYIASVVIGITLGLIGGGGSTLTVPVLVYIFSIEPVLATAYSLFIVGSSSLIGIFPKINQKLVDFKMALWFGIPSILAVFTTRKFIIPAIPDIIFQSNSISFSKGNFMMLLFSILMIVAAYVMIKKKRPTGYIEAQKYFIPNKSMIITQGVVVGVLTSMVGAGGGFLIIPALVNLTKLRMKVAIGTSLFIIALNSLIGFIGDLTTQSNQMDWPFLLAITSLSIVGILIGNALGKKIEGPKLKKGFGWFILSMGAFILIKELVLK